MPFDFKKYDAKCSQMNPEELQKEWEHYTRLISGAATSTTVSGLALPFTAGVSAIGVGMAAPAIHNARKKREIIEKHLQSHGATHQTRKRDVLGSMAFSGTVGVVTLGVGSMGAEAVASHGAEHGINAIVNNETAIKIGLHAALDGAAMAGEEAHHNHLKERGAKKMIAAAQQKIQAAQAQGEKIYGNQYPAGTQYPQGTQYPSGETVYGAVQVPGSYSANGQQAVMSEKGDIKYQPDVKYQVPPTPQYTPAPPPYPGPPNAESIASPASSIISPVPHYNPQHFAPPPAQTPNPTSPTPSYYSAHPGQPFSPVSAPAQTPYPHPQTPTYSAPPSYEPQAAAQNLPPFQSHVAAVGAPLAAAAPGLVWSHVQNQWVAQEAPPATPHSQPNSAPGQQQGYPFPQQPAVDRRASVYAPTPAPSSYTQPPATPASYTSAPVPQQSAQYPPSQTPASAPQPTYTPAPAAYSYPTPAQTPGVPQYVPSGQAPPSQTPHNAYAYPTPPAQTPGIQQPAQQGTYFPPPPTSGAQSTYTQPPTSAPQYAPVPTPNPYSNPTHQQILTPPPEHSASPTGAYQYQHGNQYQPQYAGQPQHNYLDSRHHSLPTPALTPGYDKVQQPQPHPSQAWAGPQSPHPQQPQPHPSQYHTPTHAATWGTPAPAPGHGQQPPPVQGLVDAYGGMRI